MLVVVTAAGDPVPLAPQRIVPGTSTSVARGAVAAATNGDQFFVAWQDPADLVASDWNVRFRTYDASGVPEQTFPLTAPGFATPTVVWTGSGWFIENDGRLMVVHGTPGQHPQLLLETFAPHRRAVGMR